MKRSERLHNVYEKRPECLNTALKKRPERLHNVYKNVLNALIQT